MPESKRIIQARKRYLKALQKARYAESEVEQAGRLLTEAVEAEAERSTTYGNL